MTQTPTQTQRLQVYKCPLCGHIVEVLHGSMGTLTCCGQPMQLFVENAVDASHEKHVPVVEKIATGIRVSVGSVPHPMEEKHYIEWIEVIAGEQIFRTFLQPGDAPYADFAVDAEKITVRAYCNLHGLWKGATV